MPRWLALIGLVAVLAGSESSAEACKFCCGHKVLTLRQEAAGAKVVLFGTIGKSRLGQDSRGNPTPEGVEGTTDFLIEKVVRTTPLVGEAKLIELPRYLQAIPGQEKFLIFADVHKGRLDPYRGMVTSPTTVDYLNGLLTLDQKNSRLILAHAFRHLEHPDKVIADDAFAEFEQAEYKDLREVAPTLLPDLLARWLADPKVPLARKGLYALLLGHCGREQDARLLRKLLDDAAVKENPVFERVLVGYTLLCPSEGWARIHQAIGDESQAFLLRYQGMRAIRFFWDMRPEIVARKDLKDAMGLLLNQPDISDLAIEDLRRRGQWDTTASILALRQKEAFWKAPVMRRSIVRFALCCPLPAAAQLIGELRKSDTEFVQDVEEGLQWEKAETLKTQPTES